MEALLIGLLYALLYTAVVAIVVYVIIFVLQAVGVPIPPIIIKLMWIIVALIFLILIVQLLFGVPGAVRPFR